MAPDLRQTTEPGPGTHFGGRLRRLATAIELCNDLENAHDINRFRLRSSLASVHV